MLELSAALYRKTDAWPSFAAGGPQAVAGALGELLSSQMQAACSGIDPEQVGMNFVVSTMLDLPFTSGWIDWEMIRPHTQRPHTPAFDSFVSAYECASWGYCLRYAKRFLMPDQYVAISVLDLNVFDLSYWHANPNWGNSGFGLATLLFRLSGEDRVECHIAKSINGFGEFCLDMRRCSQEDAGLTLIPPFFPHNIAAMYTKLIAEDRRLPNLTEEHGHCFGSDPWLALIQRYGAGLIGADERFLAASVALNGYWCFAEIQLAADGIFQFGPQVPEPKEIAA
jgi:hypothetical protein